MTKKDYIVISKELKKVLDLTYYNHLHQVNAREFVRAIAGQLAIGLKKDNPRFDETRFYKAIGFSG